MEPLSFSFIIPVYNRPDEINELLESFTKLKNSSDIEIVIVEDGSTVSCEPIVDTYRSNLDISYFSKSNSGPGDSRNYGMKRAKGNYFIILDSDCLLPYNYFEIVKKNLHIEFVDCFGGPDAAHESFSNIQKAINFAMTSAITTGGIRGGNKNQKNFQPRSFNMGISKRAFEASGGFGSIHPGEDPDLAIRLSKLDFKTALFSGAFVYHKRRISWLKFFQQVYKFGMVRPILNRWHPETDKFVYWLPTIFSLGLFVAFMLLTLEIYWILRIYIVYFLVAFAMAFISTKNLIVALQSIAAIFIQFLGYGYGFLKSTFTLKLSKQSPEQKFPHLFFRHVK